MTFEEMQRAMEFMVQQQAQTEVNMARLEGNMTRLEGNMTRLETSLKTEQEQRVHRDRQFAQWMSTVTELVALQSSRLDFAQKQHLDMVARLDRLLEKLTDKS